jgi:Tfp pilus assembly protein PilX
MFSRYYSRFVKIYKSRRQAGQILIIFLLILVVGLALVLSVASRSITDIRTTTTSDESNRAYFAAEAGVEEALKRLQQPGTPSDFTADLDFTAVNQTTAKIKSGELSSTGGVAYLLSNALERDAVAQVNLLNKFNDLTQGTAVGASPARLKILWGEQGAADNPAIEVTVLYYNDATSSWGLEKYAFDPITTNNNNFGTPQAGVCFSTNIGAWATDQGEYFFENEIDLRIREGHINPACGASVLTMPGIADSIWPVLARIRLLYNNVGQPVAVAAEGSWTLPSQGSEVESTGSTTSGVTRKLRVRQQYPALPSIFDYVLFSGGDLTKN